MSGEDDGTVPFKRLGAMSDPIGKLQLFPERMKVEAELVQLRAENKWLRDANKSLSEALDKARRTRGAGVV